MMALATGTGSEVPKPPVRVVIGGLLTATLPTLVVPPALCARFAVPVDLMSLSTDRLRADEAHEWLLTVSTEQHDGVGLGPAAFHSWRPDRHARHGEPLR